MIKRPIITALLFLTLPAISIADEARNIMEKMDQHNCFQTTHFCSTEFMNQIFLVLTHFTYM